jgi:uncharacterized protein YycO
MDKHFIVKESRTRLKIICVSRVPFQAYKVYINDQKAATFFQGSAFYLSKTGLAPGKHTLSIAAYPTHSGRTNPVVEQYSFTVREAAEQTSAAVPQRTYHRARDFKAGDILVASDNVNDVYTGYMGHSAIVISETELIESPGGHPAIRQDSIQQYLDQHPAHVHYRPKSAEMGQNAAEWTKGYLAKYKENLASGEKKPEFSFSLSADLDDPWVYIYCSKLVWLAYYKGAGYEFENDYLWLSPEDLYSNLKDNDQFEEIYMNPDFEFKLNT